MTDQLSLFGCAPTEPTPQHTPRPTRVVHIKTNTHTVYIGRPSRWGNPIKLRQGACMAERLDCLIAYCEWLEDDARFDLLMSTMLLDGETLGCYCAPLPCHGDVLARLASAEDAVWAELQQIKAEYVKMRAALGGG